MTSKKEESNSHGMEMNHISAQGELGPTSGPTNRNRRVGDDASFEQVRLLHMRTNVVDRNKCNKKTRRVRCSVQLFVPRFVLKDAHEGIGRGRWNTDTFLFDFLFSFSSSQTKSNLSVGRISSRVNFGLSLRYLQLEESFIQSSVRIIFLLLVCQAANLIWFVDPNNDKPKHMLIQEGSTQQGPTSFVTKCLVSPSMTRGFRRWAD